MAQKQTWAQDPVFSEDLQINILLPLGIHNTIFQAEWMGITLAARAVTDRAIRDCSIRILVDSMATLMALQSNVITLGIVMECHKKLVWVNKHINLQWIKGHNDSRGNDAANKLARLLPLAQSHLDGYAHNCKNILVSKTICSGLQWEAVSSLRRFSHGFHMSHKKPPSVPGHWNPNRAWSLKQTSIHYWCNR